MGGNIHICYIFLLLLLASSVGATATDDRVVVTSGRVVYDAFGRVVEVYHPTVDGDTVTAFRCAIDTVPPTVTAYDVLDRPVKVTCPDGSVTETDYSVSGHVQVTTVTDALGNVSKTWNAVARLIKDLVDNNDIELLTPKEYVIGYICKGLSKHSSKALD